MTEVDVARIAGRPRERTLVDRARKAAADVLVPHPGLARVAEDRGDVEMRTDADACRRVIGADVGEEEQQQQRAPTRLQIDVPLAGDSEAAVDVPSGVARVFLAREADPKCADVRARVPPSYADELIERGV